MAAWKNKKSLTVKQISRGCRCCIIFSFHFEHGGGGGGRGRLLSVTVLIYPRRRQTKGRRAGRGGGIASSGQGIT